MREFLHFSGVRFTVAGCVARLYHHTVTWQLYLSMLVFGDRQGITCGDAAKARSR